MKNKLSAWMLAACVGMSLLTVASSADAAYVCKWVHNYNRYGNYRAHKVCYHTHRHCGWHNGQRVCW